MIRRMAVLDAEDKVINIVLIETGAAWAPPKGTRRVDDDGSARIGGSYAKGKFGAAQVSELPSEPSLEEQVKILAAKVQELEAAK